MKHLGEEELIDLLMGTADDSGARDHLTTCEPCATAFAGLERGLEAAHQVKPRMPLTAMPRISYQQFTRRRKSARLTWLGVAAMLLLALTGLRLEVGANGLVVQFALFHQTPALDEARIAALEARYIHALEVHADLSQNQIDARLNAFFQENSQEMGEFSQVVLRNIDRVGLEQDRKLIELEEALLREKRKAVGPLR